MSATTQVAVTSFWEYAAFVVNSLVFLLIGLEIQIASFREYLVLTSWAIAAMLVARMVVVYGITLLTNLRKPFVPLRWQHILFWGGLRGSLSIAMVLSLPRDLPWRAPLAVMVFGAVVFSLLAQGLTIPSLLRRLKLMRPDSAGNEYERTRAQLMAETAAQIELEKLRLEGMVTDPLFRTLQENLSEKTERLSQDLSRLEADGGPFEERQLATIRQHLGQARKARLNELARAGLLSEAPLHDLLNQLDEELVKAQAPKPTTD